MPRSKYNRKNKYNWGERKGIVYLVCYDCDCEFVDDISILVNDVTWCPNCGAAIDFSDLIDYDKQIKPSKRKQPQFFDWPFDRITETSTT
jgi:hypothetical protein